MDADLPAVALAVRDLHQRSRRSRARPDLDRRPNSLHDWLLEGCGKSRAGFWNSGQRRRDSLARRLGRDRLAPCSRLKAEPATSRGPDRIALVWTNVIPAGSFATLVRAKDACERDNLLIGKIPFSSFIA